MAVRQLFMARTLPKKQTSMQATRTNMLADRAAA